MAVDEERLAKVEKELNSKTREGNGRQGWLKKVEGSFRDDATYDEILRLGREERQADVVNEE